MRRCVDLDEPLLRGAKDDGVVAAPAMRIAVFVLVVGKERVAFRKQLHNDGIGGENILAFIFRKTFEITSAIVNRSISLQPIFLAGVEVIGAVPRRGVYDATALIE